MYQPTSSNGPFRRIQTARKRSFPSYLFAVLALALVGYVTYTAALSPAMNTNAGHLMSSGRGLGLRSRPVSSILTAAAPGIPVGRRAVTPRRGGGVPRVPQLVGVGGRGELRLDQFPGSTLSSRRCEAVIRRAQETKGFDAEEFQRLMEKDPDTEYNESLYNRFCLAAFRTMVRNESGIKSELPGYKGLMEESQNFMISANKDAQKDMVVYLMSNIFNPLKPIWEFLLVPKGKEPYPWTPIIMSIFTPFFMDFLVGPSKPNLRPEDNKPGGMLIEKCRWLEEANCKGMCVNQCKLPGQAYFYGELGLPFTMRPNFTSKACQWSFGIHPLPVEEDETVPKGCLKGCPTKLMPVYEDDGGQNWI
mmetsp:Transcript_9507/g.13282  ORF Transcript_9507/g.13282 Transcript_9507/m.13282 type:complete len:362 (+) Transcript_9507:95-1180(+)